MKHCEETNLCWVYLTLRAGIWFCLPYVSNCKIHWNIFTQPPPQILSRSCSQGLHFRRERDQPTAKSVLSGRDVILCSHRVCSGCSRIAWGSETWAGFAHLLLMHNLIKKNFKKVLLMFSLTLPPSLYFLCSECDWWFSSVYALLYDFWLWVDICARHVQTQFYPQVTTVEVTEFSLHDWDSDGQPPQHRLLHHGRVGGQVEVGRELRTIGELFISSAHQLSTENDLYLHFMLIIKLYQRLVHS